MVESSHEKKKIFYMIVLILTLITLIIGATLAYFILKASQKEDSTALYTGTLQINYIDGVYIKNPELIPRSSISFETYNGVYRNNFAISSTGTLNQTLAIDMQITKNEFTENALKYALYNSKGNLLTNGIVPKTGIVNLSTDMYLEHNTSNYYTLIIWLDNTKYNQNYEMGNTVTGKIKVYAVQTKY